ncbi:MAG: hypothetical protein GX885_09065 [Methanomicrobiales archaeon]|nr:hypothetical protein [Methanomicrobiales archaeon]
MVMDAAEVYLRYAARSDLGDTHPAPDPRRMWPDRVRVLSIAGWRGVYQPPRPARHRRAVAPPAGSPAGNLFRLPGFDGRSRRENLDLFVGEGFFPVEPDLVRVSARGMSSCSCRGSRRFLPPISSG